MGHGLKRLRINCSLLKTKYCCKLHRKQYYRTGSSEKEPLVYWMQFYCPTKTFKKIGAFIFFERNLFLLFLLHLLHRLTQLMFSHSLFHVLCLSQLGLLINSSLPEPQTTLPFKLLVTNNVPKTLNIVLNQGNITRREVQLSAN